MDALTKLTAQVAALEVRVVHLEKTVDEIKKMLEERDRKQWMLWVAIFGVFLTFVANLVIALVRM